MVAVPAIVAEQRRRSIQVVHDHVHVAVVVEVPEGAAATEVLGQDRRPRFRGDVLEASVPQVAVEELVCSSGGFRKDNSYTAQHHYLASGNRVAKVFASTNARGQEAEPFYKALNQALNGLVSLRVQPTSAATSSRGADRVLAILDYPIVVCSSFAFLYAADFDGQHEPSEIRDNFQLEVQYAYIDPSGRTKDNLFVLDFVEYEKLAQFIASIQRDAEIAGYLSSSGL